MSRVNANLLAKIQQKLGIGQARAYALIAEKARELIVDRQVAALAVASDAGININKKSYASEEDRSSLSSAVRGSPSRNAPAAAPPSIAHTARATARARSHKSVSRKSNSVMVVHGRNQVINSSVFSFLRAIGLAPIEWSQAVRRTKKAAPYVGEILNAAFRTAAAVVVLLTPDDEARLRPEFVKPSDPDFERNFTGQARPNVLFEAGRAFGSHPDSTVLVQVGTVRPFSDTAGVHVVRLSDSVESRKELADRLEAAGCAVNLDGTAWMSEGSFSLTAKRPRRHRSPPA